MRIPTTYSAPEIEILVCVVECGFSLSGSGDTTIPDFDNENVM